MSLTVTIHQPDHLPWLGFMNKVDQADLFVVLDCVQLSKKVFQRRNRVIGPSDQPTWLTVPLLDHRHVESRLSDIGLNNAVAWQRRYWNILYARYHRHPAWPEHRAYVEGLCARRFERLAELNMDIIGYLLGAVGIDTPVVLASSLAPEGAGSTLLLDICRKVGAGTYLAGLLSHTYLDETAFRLNEIKVRHHAFRHPVYPQHQRERFTSHLSVIDLLFNCGDRSLGVIREGTP